MMKPKFIDAELPTAVLNCVWTVSRGSADVTRWRHVRMRTLWPVDDDTDQQQQQATSLCPVPIGEGIIKWAAVSVRPSVCLSVCGVARPNSRTERSNKPKIVRIEDDNASNQWTYLEVIMSKVKVTRPTNAETNSASYLPNGTVCEVQTWYTDGARSYDLQGQRSRSQGHMVHLTGVGS